MIRMMEHHSAEVTAFAPFGPGLRRIDPCHAHVTSDAELLVRMIERGPGPHQFVSTFQVPAEHPSLRGVSATGQHLTGEIFLIAGRQLMKSICHLYHDVPLRSRFVIIERRLSFLIRTRIDAPIEAHVQFSVDQAASSATRWTCSADIEFRQDRVCVTEGHSRFMTTLDGSEDTRPTPDRARSPAIAA